MRYTYLIKDQQGKEEEYKAMSYKKLLKQLNKNTLTLDNYKSYCFIFL